MFNLNLFIKGGLLKAVGNMADYQVILNAAGWLDKGVLTEDDLAEINAAIEEYNAKHRIPENVIEETEEIEEEVIEENSET